MTTPTRGSSATLKTHARPPMRLDPHGVVHLGPDGVLRSLSADRTAVLDYRRLSPEEAKDLASGSDQATVDALEGVDGRDVEDVEQLWAVPAMETAVTDVARLPAVPGVKTANTNTPKTYAHPPWRRDPNGVSHIGRDGVLRSLNADRTAVLDYRRLSPEEVKEFAAPFDQETRDALEGVDGRDVMDVERLWAVPPARTEPTESSDNTPAK